MKNKAVSKTPAFIASREYSKTSYVRAFFQFGSTLMLYVGIIALMYGSLSVHYSITLALSLLASSLYLRLFMIGHDCGHASYLPKKWQNQLLGEFVGVLTNTPLHYWAKQHSRHHQSTGNLDSRGDGDVITMTIEEYNESSWAGRAFYRFYRNPWVLFLLLAPLHFVVLQRVPLGAQGRTWQGWASVMGTNAGICLYYGGLIFAFGFENFLLVYGPVVFLSSLGATWLFYVQHQFEDAYWERSLVWNYHDATLEGSSFYDLPKWAHWASGNIGYHHIHHLNPKVPNYFLPVCYYSSPDLAAVNRLGFIESIQTAWLALWDEQAGKMVSFRDAPKV